MKKNYFFTLLLTLCLSGLSFGQTTLSAGDIVIIEMQGDAPDGFRFIPLMDLEVGTVIRFTDNGYTGTAIRSGEGTVIYTAPAGGITKGTNIRYSVGGTTDFILDGSSDLNISSSGDQILAYQGDTASPTFIFAAAGNSTVWQTNSNDSNQTDLPQGLTDGVNAVTLGSGTGPEAEFDNIYYSGTTSGTKADILAAVSTASNWTGNNSSSADAITTNFTITSSSVASINISSPSDGAILDATTSVDVTVSTSNFVVGELNGSGVDGHIHWTLQENSDAAVTQSMKYDTNDESITVAPGNSYTIYMELVDNTHTAIIPAVNETVTFSVAYSCDLVLGDVTTTCDAITSDTDIFSGTIAFTGGNNGTAYTIIAPSGVTVAGDNPDTTAAGTITFTGMTEGTDVIINIIGDATSSCDLYSNLVSPVCLSLPITDDFTYSDGSLIDSPLWVNNGGTMGDLMVVSGQALIQHGTPSEDANLEFIPVAGNIYYALDFTVVDPGSPISGTDAEYFAHFKDMEYGYRARLDIVPPSAAGDFSVGISTKGSTADATWATDLSYGTSYRATVKYDQDNNIAELWVDAAVEGDTSILGTDEAAPGDSMVAFVFRQSDSDLNEGILVDNLRIATTFAATTLSIERNLIEGFATYPNPVSNNTFTITTSSNSKKEFAIFNVLGKKMLSSSFSGVKSEVDVSTISSGIYILKVTEDGKTATKKLVIR
jgi:hypothetical protein